MIKQYLYILMSISMLASPVLPSASPNQKAHVLDVVTRIVGIRSLIFNYFAGYLIEQDNIYADHINPEQRLVTLFGKEFRNTFLWKSVQSILDIPKTPSQLIIPGFIEDFHAHSPDEIYHAKHAKSSKEITITRKKAPLEQNNTISLPPELLPTHYDEAVMAFSPDNKQLAVSFLSPNNDSAVYIFDIHQKKLLTTLNISNVLYIMYSPYSTYIALCTHDSVYIFESNTGRLAYKLPGRNAIIFSPDGRYLAIDKSSENNKAYISLYKEDRVEDLDEPRSIDRDIRQLVGKYTNSIPHFMQQLLKKFW